MPSRRSARALVAAFDAETAGTFADERARRKAFAARLFGPTASPEDRARSTYAFLAYDGRRAQMDALLLRRVVLARQGNDV